MKAVSCALTGLIWLRDRFGSEWIVTTESTVFMEICLALGTATLALIILISPIIPVSPTFSHLKPYESVPLVGLMLIASAIDVVGVQQKHNWLRLIASFLMMMLWLFIGMSAWQSYTPMISAAVVCVMLSYRTIVMAITRLISKKV